MVEATFKMPVFTHDDSQLQLWGNRQENTDLLSHISMGQTQRPIKATDVQNYAALIYEPCKQAQFYRQQHTQLILYPHGSDQSVTFFNCCVEKDYLWVICGKSNLSFWFCSVIGESDFFCTQLFNLNLLSQLFLLYLFFRGIETLAQKGMKSACSGSNVHSEKQLCIQSPLELDIVLYYFCCLYTLCKL